MFDYLSQFLSRYKKIFPDVFSFFLRIVFSQERKSVLFRPIKGNNETKIGRYSCWCLGVGTRRR